MFMATQDLSIRLARQVQDEEGANSKRAAFT